MSRIGLKIIEIPDDVTVNQESNKIIAKGKNGELSVEIHQSIVFYFLQQCNQCL